MDEALEVVLDDRNFVHSALLDSVKESLDETVHMDERSC